eukprot:TRINITY_DN2198_c5_g1_i1.p1 TRINITY_DN2198_c5_g1~~TRINITY_DN2198_c5_g1_i1.p1  ORF type:complete len:826 (-),score=277.95 TRINITY_DN2198_c5_g1_i1:40-2517(-)
MNILLIDLEKEIEFIHYKSKKLVDSREKLLENENILTSFFDALREYGFRYQQDGHEFIQKSANILSDLEKSRIKYNKDVESQFINPIKTFIRSEINGAHDLKKQAKLDKKKFQHLESKANKMDVPTKTSLEEEIGLAKKKSFLSEFAYSTKMETIKSLDEYDPLIGLCKYLQKSQEYFIECAQLLKKEEEYIQKVLEQLSNEREKKIMKFSSTSQQFLQSVTNTIDKKEKRKEGLLMMLIESKRSKKEKWDKVLILITNGQVNISKTSGKGGSLQKTTINLGQCKVSKMDELLRVNTFQIKTLKEVFSFQAGSKEELEEWTDYLQKEIEKIKELSNTNSNERPIEKIPLSSRNTTNIHGLDLPNNPNIKKKNISIYSTLQENRTKKTSTTPLSSLFQEPNKDSSSNSPTKNPVPSRYLQNNHRISASKSPPEVSPRSVETSPRSLTPSPRDSINLNPKDDKIPPFKLNFLDKPMRSAFNIQEESDPLLQNTSPRNTFPNLRETPKNSLDSYLDFTIKFDDKFSNDSQDNYDLDDTPPLPKSNNNNNSLNASKNHLSMSQPNNIILPTTKPPKEKPKSKSPQFLRPTSQIVSDTDNQNYNELKTNKRSSSIAPIPNFITEKIINPIREKTKKFNTMVPEKDKETPERGKSPSPKTRERTKSPSPKTHEKKNSKTKIFSNKDNNPSTTAFPGIPLKTQDQVMNHPRRTTVSGTTPPELKTLQLKGNNNHENILDFSELSPKYSTNINLSPKYNLSNNVHNTHGNLSPNKESSSDKFFKENDDCFAFSLSAMDWKKAKIVKIETDDYFVEFEDKLVVKTTVDLIKRNK